MLLPGPEEVMQTRHPQKRITLTVMWHAADRYSRLQPFLPHAAHACTYTCGMRHAASPAEQHRHDCMCSTSPGLHWTCIHTHVQPIHHHQHPTPHHLVQFLRQRYAFVVLLVDLTDVGGTLLAGIRDVVGSSPLLLVGTKADLLPGRWDPEQVVDWLRQLAGLRALQPVELMLASSHSGAGG